MAASVYRRVTRLYEKELDPSNISLAPVYDYMAEFCKAAGQKKEAKAWMQKAKSVRQSQQPSQ
jgi:hypothetical protein